ncbi:hypothetical protein GQ607_015133 [Colletotrichum asianum]|uniref:Uncharacterized protein n=1 Tax=Colletotrichum asianum TaxID=702518 RepID=A0A8H3VZ73_9PEZI|nr:hypothetical protein GQ607_015133 [Colletotrichum asianum]
MDTMKTSANRSSRPYMNAARRFTAAKAKARFRLVVRSRICCS